MSLWARELSMVDADANLRSWWAAVEKTLASMPEQDRSRTIIRIREMVWECAQRGAFQQSNLAFVQSVHWAITIDGELSALFDGVGNDAVTAGLVARSVGLAPDRTPCGPQRMPWRTRLKCLLPSALRGLTSWKQGGQR